MSQLLPPALMASLRQRYAEPQRHYHTWSHIEALLVLFEEVRPLVSDPAAFDAALYYHDAVYEPRRSDNEARSAALLRRECATLLPAQSLDFAMRLVAATEQHWLPDDLMPAHEADAALFLDSDLSILAAPEAAFVTYEEAVRREYQFVGEEEYRRGRRAVLERFMVRERLFVSAHFYPRFEAPARRNLTRSLAALT